MSTNFYSTLDELMQSYDFGISDDDRLYLQYSKQPNHLINDDFSSVGIWLEHEGRFEMKWMASWSQVPTSDNVLVLYSNEEAEVTYEDEVEDIYDSAEEAASYGFCSKLVAYK